MSRYEFDPAAPWDDADGKDPDQHSDRMKYYNRRLWSHRPLEGRTDGRTLILEPYEAGLIDTGLGETFFGLDEGLYLSSDRVMATWWNWGDTATLREDQALTARILAANPVLDNMGGVMMWPRRRVGGPSLNQERGASQKAKIADRMDLTLECIRLAYAGTYDWDASPLGPALNRYWAFFQLFGSFDGYVRFWMLEDLLTPDGLHVRFFLGGDPDGHWDFATYSPLPATAAEYDEYLTNAREFVMARNARMAKAWPDLRDE